MKLTHILIAAILLCSIANAAPLYSIRVVVWDEAGNRAADIPVTFTYGTQQKTHITASDGTVAFSLLNFDDVPDGAHINVSCKYGEMQAPVDYSIGTVGITFNEPSEADAISAFEAMGYVAIPTAVAGIYWLIRRKKKVN